MLYIAHSDAAQPLAGKKLAEIMCLNPRYLEPCLQNLVKTGVLHSAKGAKGGYSLAMAADKLTLAQICNNATLNEQKMATKQDKLQAVIIIPLFKMAEDAYENALSSITLQDLCEQMQAQKLDVAMKAELKGGQSNAISNYAI